MPVHCTLMISVTVRYFHYQWPAISTVLQLKPSPPTSQLVSFRKAPVSWRSSSRPWSPCPSCPQPRPRPPSRPQQSRPSSQRPRRTPRCTGTWKRKWALWLCLGSGLPTPLLRHLISSLVGPCLIGRGVTTARIGRCWARKYLMIFISTRIDTRHWIRRKMLSHSRSPPSARALDTLLTALVPALCFCRVRQL